MQDPRTSEHIALCVSSNRSADIDRFATAWVPYLTGSPGRPPISLYVHEDGPASSFRLPGATGLKIVHTCQADISRRLGAKDWIIPRGSGAARSFPMYLAWADGAKFILTMDDDCLPPEDRAEAHAFVPSHLAAFRMDRWFRTIDGDEPRGIPYGDRGELPVLLNHGVWTGVPDLDAPTALVRSRESAGVVRRAAREVIPPGMWFPLCAMNVCYRRDAIPAAYNLLMGLDQVGFDRFDDIWSGLFLKRIADHLGWYVTNGIPFVRHEKASDLFWNLRKEAYGLQLHEAFWKHVARSTLAPATDIAGAYHLLGEWVREFPRAHPNVPLPKGYFEKLGEAMTTWASLFSTGDVAS